MKVFISWSGELSKAVAQLLKTWLTSVLHATRPWVSTHGIESGSVWFTEVRNQLNETPVGIICMTHDNRSAPWIHFEAGALANGLAKNRVCTLLIDLKPADVENPMAQYNHTLPTKDSMLGLVRMLNSYVDEQHQVEDEILIKGFDRFWIDFDTGLQAALKADTSATRPTKRSTEDLLSEVLENTRGLANRLLWSSILQAQARGHAATFRKVTVSRNSLKLWRYGKANRISRSATTRYLCRISTESSPLDYVHFKWKLNRSGRRCRLRQLLLNKKKLTSKTSLRTHLYPFSRSK